MNLGSLVSESRNPATMNLDEMTQEFQIEVSGVPVFGADGGFQGLRGISRDVSERKRIEAEQQRLQHQLLHSQKLESIGRLASGVAHDFNNMLSIILGYAEIALDKVAPDSSLHGDLAEIASAALEPIRAAMSAETSGFSDSRCTTTCTSL